MIATVRSEWIKLRSVRLTPVLWAVGAAFPLVVVLLTSLLATPDTWDAGEITSLATGTSVVTGLLLGVVGAAAVTTEYGSGTIRVTFAATPKRMRVVLAKVIVTVLTAVVVQAVVVLATFVVGTLMFAARGAPVDLGDQFGEVLPPLLGVVVFSAILALLGLGLGLVVRATPGAIAILVLWPLVVENIVAALFLVAGVDDAIRWMPYSAGFGLTAVEPGDQSLGRLGGGLYFFAWTTVVLGVGAVQAQRRDA